MNKLLVVLMIPLCAFAEPVPDLVSMARPKIESGLKNYCVAGERCALVERKAFLKEAKSSEWRGLRYVVPEKDGLPGLEIKPTVHSLHAEIHFSF